MEAFAGARRNGEGSTEEWELLTDVNCHVGGFVCSALDGSRGNRPYIGIVNVVMRMTRRTVCAAGVLAGSMMTLAGAQARQSAGAIVLPSDADIRKVLAERVDALAAEADGVGIVVGVAGRQGRRVISYGHLSQGDPRPLDSDTGFEIGSVTKVFTALLLADMVRRGEVALADPVAKYLPAAKIPERNGRSITLLDLATHTSGLPFMPDEVPAFDDSAATKYGAAQLYQFLARHLGPPWITRACCGPVSLLHWS